MAEGHKERRELSDSGFDMIIKLCEGNPKAMEILNLLSKFNEAIDPDSAFGRYGAFVALDTYGIYCNRISLLFTDVANNNVTTTIALLRAVQMDLLKENILDAAIDTRTSLDIPIICSQLKLELPNFNWNVKTD